MKQSAEKMYQYLAAQAEKQGFLSFKDFMAAALYHPEYGYYSTGAISIGRQGDFSTCLTLDPIVSSAICGWIENSMKQTSQHGDYHIVELGGGSGELLQAVMRNISKKLLKRIIYHIVDINPALKKQQREKISSFDMTVTWQQQITDALHLCEGNCLIIGHEFLDTFPVRILEWTGSEWFELFLTVTDRHLSEYLGPPHPPISGLPGYSFEKFIPPQKGQRIEIATSLLNWWLSWNDIARDVTWLSIDYGDYFPGLYRKRPGGTVRAYWNHHRFDGIDIYKRPGKQDLTADVNFSDLILWADYLNWEVTYADEQHQFISDLTRKQLNPLTRLFHPPENYHQRLLNEHNFVMSKWGAGAAFKVLVLQKKQL